MFSRITEILLRGKREEKEEDIEKKINTLQEIIFAGVGLCLSLLNNKKGNGGSGTTEKRCSLILKEVKKFLEKNEGECGFAPWQKMREEERLEIKKKLQEVIREASGMQELQKEAIEIIGYIDAASFTENF